MNELVEVSKLLKRKLQNAETIWVTARSADPRLSSQIYDSSGVLIMSYGASLAHITLFGKFG
jgi:hypothetical protein